MKTSKKWLVLTLAFTMLCLLTACGNDNKANGNVNGATAGTNNTGNNKEQNGTTDTDSTPTNSPTGAGTNNTTDNDNSLMDGAGDLVDDTGNAVGDAIDDIGNTVGDVIDDAGNAPIRLQAPERVLQQVQPVTQPVMPEDNACLFSRKSMPERASRTGDALLVTSIFLYWPFYFSTIIPSR